MGALFEAAKKLTGGAADRLFQETTAAGMKDFADVLAGIYMETRATRLLLELEHGPLPQGESLAVSLRQASSRRSPNGAVPLPFDLTNVREFNVADKGSRAVLFGGFVYNAGSDVFTVQRKQTSDGHYGQPDTCYPGQELHFGPDEKTWAIKIIPTAGKSATGFARWA